MARSAQSDIRKLLQVLHDTPIDNAGASDEVLGKVYAFLMDIPQSPSDNKLHWFCKQANTTTVAAASFLLRLFAYSSTQVDLWKKRLQSCLQGCCNCVQLLERIKVDSRHTYFGAFSDSIMKIFYRTFEIWDLECVLQDVTNNVDCASNSAPKKVSSVAIYRMLFNWTIFSDSRIQSILQQCPDCTNEWPKDSFPPGLILFLFHDSPRVRLWARNHISRASVIPMSSDQFVGMYTEVKQTAIGLISPPATTPPLTLPPEVTFTKDTCELWDSFSTFLRFVPVEQLKSKSLPRNDFCHLIVGHLHDNGPQFAGVLRSFLLLLKRLGDQFWSDESSEYPQVVFDAVKDNPSFTMLLAAVDISKEKSWYLTWFSEFLHTLRALPVFDEVLAKLVGFLCEEMQHERFKEARPFIMNSAMRLLDNTLHRQVDEGATVMTSVSHVIDIHAETFVSLAFSRSYLDEIWRTARASSRALISRVLIQDIEQISSVITALCTILAEISGNVKNPTQIPDFSIRRQIWTKLYLSLQANDLEGLVAIISIVARCSHFDVFSKIPFLPIFQSPNVARGYMTPELAYKAVNTAVGIFSDGFANAMNRFSDCNVSTSGLDILRRPGAAKDVMLLLLSPMEQIQNAAKTLITLAFDVDGRLECFRAMLENLPDASFEGILEFLSTYIQFASVVPEACSLSGSLVRCFTDIIEVLCASPDGLLRDTRFLRPENDHGPASRLPLLWTLMTKSLAVIFKRCPSWSVYFENEEMIVWMRDALIFGRDMLAQWRVMEKAASSRQPPSTSSRRLSIYGKKMVDGLQGVLPELARWLRLTDEELLHQSFALIQSLLDVFQESGVRPSEEGLSKLSRHIENAKVDSKHPKTRLDASRLSALASMIASFEGDEVEIVSYSLGQKDTLSKKQDFIKVSQKSSANKEASLPDSILKKPTHATQLLDRKPPLRFFTEDDQRTLDVGTVLPSFKMYGKANVPDGRLPNSHKKGKQGIKDESKFQSLSSSSESSEGESDDEPHVGLSALAKFQKSPKVKRPTERRQVKTIEIAGVGNPLHLLREKRNRQEEARRTACRMRPDVSHLHKVVLSWDYDCDGPMPPGEKLNISHVPDTFRDYEHYRQVFEPLLLMECWAQICQAKDEPHEAYDIEIGARQFTDDWLDIDILLKGTVKKEWYLAETDVVLLRQPLNKKCILAKTKSYRALPHAIQATLRCYLKNGSGDPGLHQSTVWQVSKIYSLSTIHREYAALVSLAYYDFVEAILKSQLSMPAKVNLNDVQNAMIRYGVNEPQAKAILSSLETPGFSLIQGPPGTGKTSTICGLVGVFLSNFGRSSTAISAGKPVGTLEKGSTSKILICAPSNAAIDEIAYRIKEGYRGSRRRPDHAKVVRIGAEKAINVSVKDISLDTLVDQKLNKSETVSKEKSIGDEVVSLRQQIASVKELRSQKLQELTNIDNAARSMAIEEELKHLNSKRMTLTQQLDRLKDQQKSESRTLDAIRRKTRLEVLHEADVICATLSGSGHETLDQFDFETIVIDEAAQAIELSSLIPLRYRYARCIMVGDPQQLPPTASRYLYNQSLFVRLQKQRPEAMQLLSIQYRMHPDLSRLPSRVFYHNRLDDGPDMAAKTAQPWHSHPKFGTYKFFNVKGTEEQSNRSLINRAECQAAAALYARIKREFSSVDLDFRVGVVSMYRAQVYELRRQFERYMGEKLEGIVDFNTVDGFQGQEKDIIILSCVRGGLSQDTVGFLAEDLRRMNVALTRAKSSLFILGNVPTLERSNTTWAEIIADARSRSCLVDADATFFTLSGSLVLPPTPILPAYKPLKAVPTPVPIPVDLITPKDFKASIGQNQLSIKPTSMSTIEKATKPDPIEGSPLTISVPRPSTTLKRPFEHHEKAHEPPLKTSRIDEAHPSEPKPRAPLAKRPKQQTMFIPKKKRP
ncbi:hypothetical protein AMATHDRAFT_705 [Amanita thiersii Skay4041]|uniref:UvrD-like helicase ATP-binding domain-containing protein n=1 Tax=Amanita thiersii Skay4041 TaxID=703135 RepID=A0A2A9P0E5_9AGAR|nr:hypothetical protein AMATHDRAFT_705 [Amanita thiersii Skay4041]